MACRTKQNSLLNMVSALSTPNWKPFNTDPQRSDSFLYWVPMIGD